MKYVLISLALILLASCGTMIPVAELRQELEAGHTSLMQDESEASGVFIRRRTFHQELMQQRLMEDAEPYPLLDTTFKSMYRHTDFIILNRMRFSEELNAFNTAVGKKKKIREGSEAHQIYATGTLVLQILENENDLFRTITDSLEQFYDSTCKTYGIVRLDHWDYLEVFGLKLFQFSDSLEEQGRIIASCRNELNKLFPERRGPEFFSHYQHLSNMEAKFKVYQSLLSQFENANARFESVNPEEVYFIGPYLRKSIDIQATEDIIGKLILEMQEFRKLYDVYADSFTP